MEGHNESMLQVNSGKVDSEKAGFNRFHVKLTSKSEKKMAYEVRFFYLYSWILWKTYAKKTMWNLKHWFLRPISGWKAANCLQFRTLKCEEDKDLAPGILKPGEVVTVVKYLAKDVDVIIYIFIN